MKDIAIEGNLVPFVSTFGFSDLEMSEQFERFCCYSMLNRHFDHSLNEDDLNEMSLGDNKGIDAISIQVNGDILTDSAQLNNGELSAKLNSINLYFLQSKFTSSFQNSEIINFFDTIIDFLSSEPSYPMSLEAKNMHDLYLMVIRDLSRIQSFNLIAFYCTAGIWKNDNLIIASKSKRKAEIESLKLFDNVSLEMIDKASLIENYRLSRQPLKAKFDFQKRVSLENVPNVLESYIGYIRFQELKKIIVEEGTNRLRNLFYYNIRDFLGIDNEVNEKIAETINKSDFQLFALLNNGITIVAEGNTGRSDSFILDNMQIVNGCQTTNILHELKDIQGIDDTLIPLKLVITKDEGIRDRIILASNSQSKIRKEELLGLTSFQRQLEEYYKNSGDGLFYERRNRQYEGDPDVKKFSIVTIREQIKSFISVFLEEPDRVSGYFSSVLKEKTNELFSADHLFEPYYISGLIQFRFKELLNSKDIDRKYNRSRYHIYLLFRMFAENSQFKKSFLNGRKQAKYFYHIIEILRSKKEYLSHFNSALGLIDKSKLLDSDPKSVYLKTTTQKLSELFNTSKMKD